ncbi:hypothetical protein FACS189429_7330 [Bacteroidia bacterium]|nr:hypothetical protein FACS189429_7330 [Bacteroidia bacterium]
MLFAAILLISSGNAWGHTGTFTKITSLSDLTDGYYVIAGNSGTFNSAMKANSGSNYYDVGPVTVASNSISNPADIYVWQIATYNGHKTIRNVDDDNYVSYSGSGNSAQLSISATNANQHWDFALQSSGVFRCLSVGTSGRSLQYNSSSPRFACYTNTQQDMVLYKLVPSCTPATTLGTFDLGSTVAKTTNDGSFTNAFTLGQNTSAPVYTSTVPAVATVDAATGEVTIAGAGTTTIKATQADDGTYCETEVSYTLNVTPYAVPTAAVQGHNSGSGDQQAPEQPAAIYLGDQGLTFGCMSWANWDGNWPIWKLIISPNANLTAPIYNGGWSAASNNEHRQSTSGQFTEAGTFYWGIQIDYQGDKPMAWYGKDITGNDWQNLYSIAHSELTLTVLPLENPALCSATSASTTTITLSATEWLGREMMIVRYPAGAPATAPSNGTSYSAGAALGAGKVLFCGFGEGNTEADSKTITDDGESGDPLTAGTSYDYYFYSVNYNYYSAGEKRSATTPLIFDANPAVGAWMLVSAPLASWVASDFAFGGNPLVYVQTMTSNTSNTITWTPCTGTAPFAQGEGFAYKVNAAIPADFTGMKTLTGSAAATSFTKTIPAASSQKYSLLGNPFNETIRFADFTGGSNNNVFKPAGYYELKSDGTYQVGDGTVEPWRGFLVLNLNGGAVYFDIDFINGSGLPGVPAMPEAKITLTSINENGSNYAYLMNNENGQTSVGNYDLNYINADALDYPQVYTLKENTKLGINTVNTNDAVIPVGILAGYNGQTTLNLQGMNTYACNVILKDNATGQQINLTGMANYDYVYFNQGSSDSRFELVLNSRVPTAVTDNATAYITVFSQNKSVEIISSEMLDTVEIYGLIGNLVYAQRNVNATTMTPELCNAKSQC